MSLAYIFQDSDKIFICNTDEFGTKDHFIGNVYEVANELNIKSREFYCVNPVRDKLRRKSELSSLQSFLFESDSDSLEKQYALLPAIMELGIVRMATYSGNKSIHYIVSCADDLYLGEPGSDAAEQAYKQIWAGLEAIFTDAGLKIDTSGKNPATLSRLPGMFRDDKQTQQRLLTTGNLITSEFLRSIAIRKTKYASYRETSAVIDLQDLETKMAKSEHQRLAMQIKYPAWISDNDGNYPELLRVSLWAIDEVGATPDTLLPYFEKHLVPYLRARNYHKDWQVPVLHAFRKKGLL